jgi:hypothetical protein
MPDQMFIFSVTSKANRQTRQRVSPMARYTVAMVEEIQLMLQQACGLSKELGRGARVWISSHH